MLVFVFILRQRRRDILWLDVEFELKIDGRIVEAAHGCEGDFQLLRNIGEGKADLEAGIGHLQIPILVLDDDRHLFWIALAQAGRDAHAWRAGQEGDEEVVVARQPGARHFAEHLAHDAAQCLLGQNVVSDVVFGHCAPTLSAESNCIDVKKVMRRVNRN